VIYVRDKPHPNRPEPPGHVELIMSRIDRYPRRPRSAAAHGAMQVMVPGNNAGENTSLLSRA